VSNDNDPHDDGAARFARFIERETRAWLSDLAAAGRLLTRVPPLLRRRIESPDAATGAGPIGRAARAFPLVGALVGLAAGLAFAIIVAIGLPTAVAAIVALAIGALVTGALHEDGLADTADGFGGGSTREQKLAMMHDSRIGAYGVLALVLVLAAKLGALIDLEHIGIVIAGLVCAGASSRAMLPALMHWLLPARPDGLGAAAGQPPASAVYVGLAIAFLLSVILLSWSGIVAFIIGGIGAFGMAQLAKRQVGGHTGDILGATQQVSGLLFLLTIAAIR
jgi:adenosylcobinamide-GDP ribazoletransferase